MVVIPKIPRAAEARLLATNSDRTKNTSPSEKTKGTGFCAIPVVDLSYDHVPKGDGAEGKRS
jgi:hypothetical protein